MSSASSSSSVSSSSSDASSVASRSPSPPPVNEKKRKRAQEPAPVDPDAALDADEPVLSHAAKRKQKKKELKGETATTSGSGKDNATSGKESAADRPKRQNSIWVGNLSFKTTPDALKTFFDGAGEITRVHMPTKMVTGGPGGARKENRGFAYVDFSTPDAKVVAITMSENHLDGRKLLIKDGGDFTGRPAPAVKPEGEGDASGTAALSKGTGMTKTAQKILKNQKQPPAPTLFFGNLGFDVTVDSLRELLDAHRQKSKVKEEDTEDQKPDEKADKWIRKIRLGTFEDSGKCKGWAFVDFTSIEHATTALTNPRNHRLNGRDLVVEFASPDAVRRGGGGPRPPRDRDSTSTYKGRQDGEYPPKKRQKFPEGGAPDESADAPTGDPALSRERTTDTHGGRDARERTGKDRGKRHRPAPGAALALAKREQVGIVPSEGTKITFD